MEADAELEMLRALARATFASDDVYTLIDRNGGGITIDGEVTVTPQQRDYVLALIGGGRSSDVVMVPGDGVDVHVTDIQ